MSGFYRFARAIVVAIVKILFPMRVIGIENIPKSGGVILCCNHTSLTDVFFLGVMCKRQIHFMAKSELFKNKLLGFILKNLGAFAVQRGRGDVGAVKTAQDVIVNGEIMGIFPEGTRNSDGPPIKAKVGVAMIAANTKADILPVSIYHKGRIKPFIKTTVRVGEVIPFEELCVSDSDNVKKSELKYICELIMQKITQLWEMGH